MKDIPSATDASKQENSENSEIPTGNVTEEITTTVIVRRVITTKTICSLLPNDPEGKSNADM